MGYYLGVYFNSPKSFEELIRWFEAYWGVTLERSDEFLEARYKGFGLTVVVIGNHEMVDDMDINFSDYKYEILINTFMRHTGTYDMVRSFAFWIAHLLHEKFNWPCMVVVDSQEVILKLPSL